MVKPRPKESMEFTKQQKGLPVLSKLTKLLTTLSKKNVEKSSNQKNHLKIGTWNIKRGLVKRELEIANLPKSEKLDVLFLTETDLQLNSAEDFKLEGYKTSFHLI